VLAVGGVKEAVGSCVFVGISKGEFVADGVFLKKSECVADSDVVVCARNEISNAVLHSERNAFPVYTLHE
jgi:ribonuclease PH